MLFYYYISFSTIYTNYIKDHKPLLLNWRASIQYTNYYEVGTIEYYLVVIT